MPDDIDDEEEPWKKLDVSVDNGVGEFETTVFDVVVSVADKEVLALDIAAELETNGEYTDTLCVRTELVATDDSKLLVTEDAILVEAVSKDEGEELETDTALGYLDNSITSQVKQQTDGSG